MKTLKFFVTLFIASLLFVACSDDDDNTPDEVATCSDNIQNGDETGVDCGGSSCTPCEVAVTCDDGIQNGDEEGVDCGGTACTPCTTGVEIPDTYVFERDGESTVSFSGQTTRLKMAKEILGKLRDNTSTEADILAAYDHQEGTDNFSEADLNASDKQVRNKTAGSYFFKNLVPAIAATTVVADFEGFIEGQVTEVFPAWNNVAAEGVAGQLPDGSSTRYVNARGLEYDQAFIKGLTGAFVSDQIVGNYTFPANLEQFEAANDSGTIVGGKAYTDLEHDWDEAYGYFFGLAADGADPVAALLTGGDPSTFSSGDDEFLYKYIDNVEANFDGTAQAIFDAFKAGRTAIINKDYAERDAQADIIREKVAMVVAVRAIHYLKAGQDTTTSPGTRLHDLSEAYGFIYSLQFLLEPGTDNTFYFTRTEVEGYLDAIYNTPTNGFWGVTAGDLGTVADAIAAKFSFTAAEVD
ncbi:MAG: DUF4856 domain-containing protein [Bacteroidota bacterium]